MKVLGTPMSGCTRAVLTVCKQQGIDITFDLIPRGAQFEEAYGEMNPHRKFPVLVDGDTKVYEHLAIIKYILDSKKPDTPIYPKDPKKRAKIEEATNTFNDLRVQMNVLTYAKFHHKMKKLPPPPEATVKKATDYV